MTRDEAVAELAAVAQGFENLYMEADRNGGGCWWCCGGGDEWRDDLIARQGAVLAEYPDLATVNGQEVAKTVDLDALERSIAEGETTFSVTQVQMLIADLRAAENAVAEDRAAVVTWLRGHGMAPYAQSNLDYAATMIERGAHRREEG